MSLFADDMILYTETLRLTPKLLKLINEFNKIAGYTINIQKSVVFSLTNNELPERESKKTYIYNHITFIIISQE